MILGDVLTAIMEGMPYLTIVLVFLLLAKVFYDKTTSFHFNDELTEKDNPAFGICLAGYLVGVGIALAGSLYGTGSTQEEGFSDSIVNDLISIFISGIATILLMRLSIFINDKAILYRFRIEKEMIEDRNIGTGFVVAGGCLATGFMLNGVMHGESGSFLMVIRDILVYWLVGQILLVVSGFVFQKITSYDVHKTIGEDDNIPAGISFGGFLVGIGIIVRSALAGASSDLWEELQIVLAVWLIGIVLLVTARAIADKIFLPNSPLSKEVAEDKNPAAGAIAAASFICIALLLAATLTPFT